MNSDKKKGNGSSKPNLNCNANYNNNKGSTKNSSKISEEKKDVVIKVTAYRPSLGGTHDGGLKFGELLKDRLSTKNKDNQAKLASKNQCFIKSPSTITSNKATGKASIGILASLLINSTPVLRKAINK